MNKKLIIVSVVLSVFILLEGIALGVCFGQLDKNKVYSLSDFESYYKLKQITNYDYITKMDYVDGHKLVDDKPLTIEIKDREAIAEIHGLFENALVRKVDGNYGGNLDSLKVYYADGEVLSLPVGLFNYNGVQYGFYGTIPSQVWRIVNSIQN